MGPERMRVTQKTIADKAGVAQTTVSYVLTNSAESARIAEATRRRIERIARDLGYRANRNARKLATGRAQAVGVLVHRIGGAGLQVWNELAMGAEEEILSAGYQALLSFHDPDRTFIEQAEMLVRDGSADGVVALAWSGDRHEFHDAAHLDFPLSVYSFHPDETHVRHDATVGLRDALDYLRALGHERVLWVEPTLRQTDLSRERGPVVQAYGAALGIRVEPLEITSRGQDITMNYASEIPRILGDLRARLPSPFDFTAAMCWNDLIAHAVCAALRERGRRIPEDVSVIGYDDIQALAHAPPLTTVSGVYRKMGAAAARMVLDYLEQGPHEFQPVVLPTRLVVRQSTERSRSAARSMTAKKKSRRESGKARPRSHQWPRPNKVQPEAQPHEI